jgi:hypothetical protein
MQELSAVTIKPATSPDDWPSHAVISFSAGQAELHFADPSFCCLAAIGKNGRNLA